MSSLSAVVLTWGCSHNQKDSQLIEYQLLSGGYKLLSPDNIESADIVVVNTCTVKTPTEDKIFHVLDQLKKTEKTVVVAGCISQAEPEIIEKQYPNFIRLGVNAASQILNMLNIVNNNGKLLTVLPTLGLKNNKVDWLEKPAMISTQWNPHLNIIQINEGCLNSCTFCATKKARGHLRSYSRSSIISSIREIHTPEVWLTSQDTACWGFDLGENLTHLIYDINDINRKFWVRVGMGNPNNMIKIIDSLVKSYGSDKIYKFVHVPLQSGSNEVLKHMRRGYTVEEYYAIIGQFKTNFPEITISTDIICGYPTETEEDFQATVAAIRKTRPSITNISRFWKRRGTPAAELSQIPLDIVKQRSGILTKICQQIQMEDNQHWIGWEGEIYLAEMGSKGGIQARNLSYKPIIVDLPEKYLGSFHRARIIEAYSTYLKAEVIE